MESQLKQKFISIVCCLSLLFLNGCVNKEDRVSNAEVKECIPQLKVSEHGRLIQPVTKATLVALPPLLVVIDENGDIQTYNTEKAEVVDIIKIPDLLFKVIDAKAMDKKTVLILVAAMEKEAGHSYRLYGYQPDKHLIYEVGPKSLNLEKLALYRAFIEKISGFCLLKKTNWLSIRRK